MSARRRTPLDVYVSILGWLWLKPPFGNSTYLMLPLLALSEFILHFVLGAIIRSYACMKMCLSRLFSCNVDPVWFVAWPSLQLRAGTHIWMSIYSNSSLILLGFAAIAAAATGAHSSSYSFIRIIWIWIWMWIHAILPGGVYPGTECHVKLFRHSPR